jgi:hypothetical protein
MIPDRNRFKVGSRGRPLDLAVRDTAGALPNLNLYTSATAKWYRVGEDPTTAVALTTQTKPTSPVTYNLRVDFTFSELSAANVGEWWVFVDVETSSGIHVQPPENEKGIRIEIFK